MDCIFCNILASIIPAAFVYEDDLCVAFMDIHPINPGHILVVPRRHSVLLTELDPLTACRMMQVAQKLHRSLRESAINCEGINLFLADGRAAGQEVMHVHLHIIPRFRGDGHHLRFSPAYAHPPALTDLEAIAGQIRAQLKGKP